MYINKFLVRHSVSQGASCMFLDVVAKSGRRDINETQRQLPTLKFQDAAVRTECLLSTVTNISLYSESGLAKDRPFERSVLYNEL